jgi:hypothetical protein
MNAAIENFIGIYEDAFSKEYCNSLIKYFEDLSAAGLTETRQLNNPNVFKTKQNDEQLFAHEMAKIKGCTSTVAHFNNVFWGELYPHYCDNFDVLKEYGPHNNYYFKIQKTKIGQGYHVWHSEQGNGESANRCLVYSIYLNNIDAAGETEFLYQKLRIPPKENSAILWPAAFTHTHRGNVVHGDTPKYIITGWFYLE